MPYVELAYKDTDGHFKPIPVVETDPASDSAGMPVRVVDSSEVSSTGVINALNGFVELQPRGRRVVSVHVVGALTATMDLLIQHSYDGVNFGEREFWNGDNGVIFDHLPHPLNNERFYSLVVSPTIKYIRVTAFAFTSGSVTIHMVANEQDDVTLYSGIFPKSRQSIPTVLDDVNDAVTMTNYGDSIGFFVESGSLVGTLVVEAHPFSHGTTGWVNVPFWANNQWRTAGYAIASPATGFGISPLMSQAFMRYRLRLSADGGGTLTAHGRCGGVKEFIGITHGIPLGVAPVWAELIGGKDGAGNIEALLTDTGGALVTVPSDISITPTGAWSIAAYTAEDVFGGELVLANATRIAGGYTMLTDIFMSNAAPAVPFAGDIFFFNADPAGTYTDNGAFPSLSTDVAKLVGKVTVAAGDWITHGGYGTAHIKNINIRMKSAATTSLWAVMVTTAAVDLAATSDFVATFNFERQ